MGQSFWHGRYRVAAEIQLLSSLFLSEDTDLFYPLREFETAYRYAPTGGSVPIRAHMRTVRERISRTMKANPTMRFPEPANLPVASHLGRALDNGEREPTEVFVRTVAKLALRLRWEYGYENVRPTLARKYGYADILGPAGFIGCEDLAWDSSCSRRAASTPRIAMTGSRKATSCSPARCLKTISASSARHR